MKWKVKDKYSYCVLKGVALDFAVVVDGVFRLICKGYVL